MGQGQANINVRSDVTLSIEGARSTPNPRLQQIAEAATDQLPSMRRCYRELAAKRPSAAGALAVRITFAVGSAPPLLELKPRPGSDAEVVECVQRTLSKALWRKVERPSAAILTLEFDNSRAKGEQEMTERRQVAERVEITASPSGGYEASWSPPDGKVAFRVTNPRTQEAIEPTLLKLRESFAGFADCRRRSEHGGLSPAGTLEIQLELAPKTKSRSKVTSSTVAHPRAVPCVERLLKSFQPAAEVPATLTLHITFGMPGPPAAPQP